MQWKRWLLAASVIVLAGSALLSSPPKNPAVIRARTLENNVAMPPPIAGMLRRACYDCHSNETQWPWYSRIPGVASMLTHDVSEGRKYMNFSEWPEGGCNTTVSTAAILTSACAGVKSRQMPKSRYLLLHPSARLSPGEIETFCAWTNLEWKKVRASAIEARVHAHSSLAGR